MEKKNRSAYKAKSVEASNPKGWLYKSNGKPLDLAGPLEVLVKFSDTISIPYKEGAELHLKGENKKFWETLAVTYGKYIRLIPAFTGVKPEDLRALVEKALKTNPKLQDANLLNYFVIAKNIGSRKAKKLLLDLDNWPAVDKAFIELPTYVASGSVNVSDPRVACQGYLEPAPIGVDARHAWEVLDSCDPDNDPGSGEVFVDIEEDWPSNMPGTPLEFIEDPANPCLHPNGGDANHGANVLRIVCGSDSTPGGLGIVPGLKVAKLVSSLCFGGARHTIVPAALSLPSGGIMLIEVQVGTPFLPVEANYAAFAAIQTAVTGQNIVCIVPAGNGEQDLDDIVQFEERIFDRTVRDSGAIFVGASIVVGDDHEPWSETNVGSIIDTFAWGSNVYAYAADNGNPVSACPNSFGGTSSAAAIVAGVAIAAQHMSIKKTSVRKSSTAMRALLSTNGTDSVNGKSIDKIGTMPDLKKIDASI